MNNPVIILAFANSTGEPLPMLNTEADQIQETLENVEHQTHIRTVCYPRFSLDKIVDTLSQRKWKVPIFHFAGHAEGETLVIGDQGLAFGKLGRIFAKRFQTKLVFLNGCGTMNLVGPLLDAGVPAVIATANKVADDRAAAFAKGFYDALAGGATLDEAFRVASELLQARFPDEEMDFVVRSVDRRLSFAAPEEEVLHNHWELFLGSGQHRMLGWTLYDDHSRKRKLRTAYIGIICLVALILGSTSFWGNLHQDTNIHWFIRNQQGGQDNFDLPTNYDIQIVYQEETLIVPLLDWHANQEISHWLWEEPEVKASIVRDGKYFSDPNATFFPTHQGIDTILVNPIWGSFQTREENLNFNRPIPLAAEARNLRDSVLARETFWITPPRFRLQALLPYKFFEIQAKSVE